MIYFALVTAEHIGKEIRKQVLFSCFNLDFGNKTSKKQNKK